MRGKAEIMQELERKRAEMVRVGMEKGFTHELTVMLSQEVDELHNEHMAAERAEKIGGMKNVV